MVNLERRALCGTLIALLSLTGLSTAATISLVPVSASGSHTIVGNKIRLGGGGQRVVLEIQLSDWAPDHLRSWQTRIDKRGFSSGLGAPLIPADEECSIHPDCFAVFAYGSLCYYPVPIGGHCAPAFINSLHANWVFRNEDCYVVRAFSMSDVADFVLFEVLDSPCYTVDAGGEEYAGTLILDVPADARGAYTIPFVEGPDKTFMGDEYNHVLPALKLISATITILCDSDADCDDGNACTADACDVDECVNIPGCVSEDDCDDSDSCTVDVCTADGCCENTLQCTTDDDCEPGGECTIGLCTTDGCCFIAPECGPRRDCDDANECTLDSCAFDGCCRYIPDCEAHDDCDDGSGCTTDSCTAEGCCEYSPQCVSDDDCDDADSCTVDSCSLEGCCEHQPTLDDDGDGVANDCDVCPDTPAGVGVDGSGRPLGDQDGDCDTDLKDFRQFTLAGADLDYYRLLFAGLTGPLP